MPQIGAPNAWLQGEARGLPYMWLFRPQSLNAMQANAGASTVVGSILLPTLDVKPERNGPWPAASGPKLTCLGQWHSSKQRSWWEPQGIRRWVHQEFVCLLVGCLTSQQQASVSQWRICSDNFTCCHTEIEAADQTFHLTQSQYTDTGPTSPSADPRTPGAWQGSHWSANF